MKQRLLIRLGWTAIASPALLLVAGVLSSTHHWWRWLAWPFVKPGAGVTILLTPKDAHMPDLAVLALAEFVCNWILLFAMAALFDKLITLRREHA